jgi:hypothetical protein
MAGDGGHAQVVPSVRYVAFLRLFAENARDRLKQSSFPLDPSMHAPSLLERVLVMGSDALFLVIRADQDEQVADLLSFTLGQPAMQCVPFGMLEAWELEGLLTSLPPS